MERKTDALELTHGNFFSGSGTWELMMKLLGVKTLWESEIEPFPSALEAKRFPEARQLGDIRLINGAEIEPVDIITNSSPCTDISLAGGRQGMSKNSGTRSSLFHEVIRITKEMREHEKAIGRTIESVRPSLWCWENVTGLLSSNGGDDFRAALEEIARIKDPKVSIPRPEKRWSNGGFVDGDGWSISWAVRDSSKQGVAQKRRRVFVVADFRGNRASEILYKSEGLSWSFAEIAEIWETVSRSLEERIDSASEIVRRGL